MILAYKEMNKYKNKSKIIAFDGAITVGKRLETLTFSYLKNALRDINSITANI